MGSIEVVPSPPLRPYVQLIWWFELDDSGQTGPSERIAPDGIVEIVFHYRDPFALRFAGESFAPQPRSSLVFQARRYVEFHPAGGAGMISVRLRPWGACQFLRMPLSELADRMVSAQDVWGAAAAELEDRLATASDGRSRISQVEEFLLRQLQRYQKADVEAVVRAVWERKGNMSMRDLRDRLGLGERRMERLFQDALGMPPKSYSRLARFLHSCAVLRSGGWRSLTEVGHDCGYYDQAHFIHDFQAYSGQTPREFVQSTGFSFLEIE